MVITSDSKKTINVDLSDTMEVKKKKLVYLFN